MKVKDIITKLKQRVSTNAGNFVQNEVQSIRNPIQFARTAIPNTQQAIQNVGQYQPRIAAPIMRAQPVFDRLGTSMANPSRIQFADRMSSQIKAPKLRFGASIPLGMAESLVNAPSNYVKGITRTGFNLADSYNNKPVGVKKYLGDAAPTAEAILDVGTFGVGKQIVKQGVQGAAKAGLKQTLKRGAVTGGVYGGAYGLLQGLDQAKNINNNVDYAKKVGGNTAMGATMGALFGGGLSAGGYGAGQIKNRMVKLIQQRNNVSPEQANKAVDGFIRDELGRFTGKNKAKVEPMFYSDLREQLGLPRNGQYNQGFARLDLGLNKDTPKIKSRGTGSYTNIPKNDNPLLDIETPPSVGDILKERYKSGTPPPNGNIPITNPQDPFYNVQRIGVNSQTKQGIKDVVETPEMRERIGAVVGDKLTLKEVQDAAKLVPEMTSTKTRQATLELGAQAQALRNKVADLSTIGLDDEQFKEALIQDKAFGTYLARLLGQRRIVSNPSEKTLFNNMISKIIKEGYDPEKVAKEAKNINFNNVNEATEFYRKFIKTTPGDWLDLVRYNSMLSSPNTHINNAFSNLQGTGALTPIQKTIEGVVDAFASGGAKALGKDRARTRLAGEGVEYAKGYYTNVGNAWSNLVSVMKGTTVVDNPDTRQIKLSTGGASRGVENVLGVVSKALEGMDIFFRTMTEGGLKKATAYRGTKLGQATIRNVDVRQEAEDMLYRGQLVNNQEGVITHGLGSLARLVSNAKNSDNSIIRWTAKFSLPFVNTGTNLAKKGIEHNIVLGPINLVGNQDKIAAISKMILGAAISSVAVPLAANDRLTFGYPASKKEKDAFINAGMQPYALKIGDKWFSYAKLDPAIGFQLATIAGVSQALKDQRINEDNATAIIAGFVSGFQFFANQTYLKNVSDLMATIQGGYTVGGDALGGFSRLGSNYVTQVIPFRAFLGWVNRMVDEYQRAPDKDAGLAMQTFQNMVMSIPGLSQKFVPTRKDSQDQPLQNKERFINAFSPVRVTTENPEELNRYDYQSEVSRLNRLNADIKKLDGKVLENITDGQIYVKDPEGKIHTYPAGSITIDKDGKLTLNDNPIYNELATQDKKKEYEQKIAEAEGPVAKARAEKNYKNYLSDSTKESLTKDSLKSKNITGELAEYATAYEFDKFLGAEPTETIKKIKYDNEKLTKARQIYNNEEIPEDIKGTIFKKLGYDPNDIEYDAVANMSSIDKATILEEQLKSMSPENAIDTLISARKQSLSGDLLASDKTLDYLVDAEIISYEDAKALKKIDLDKKGKTKVASGKGKGKKLKVKKITAGKLKVGKGTKMKRINVKLRRPTAPSVRNTIKVKPTKKINIARFQKELQNII